MWSWAHLKGAQEKVKEELDVAQGALGMLICDEGKDHLVDAQQWDQRQCGLGQPVWRVMGRTHTHTPVCAL